VNPHHYAPGNHTPPLLRQLPWRGHPRHCATLCGVISKRPAALYHPLPYGRRTAPSKKDDETLEGMTHDYCAPARDGAVMSGQWGRSPPSPSALCDCPRHRNAIPTTASPCPTLWNGQRQDIATPGTVPCTTSCQRHPRVLARMASERATSMPPPSKPLLETHRACHDAPSEEGFARANRLLRGTVRDTFTCKRNSVACL
jgi:hypothetical protein